MAICRSACAMEGGEDKGVTRKGWAGQSSGEYAAETRRQHNEDE